MSDPGEELPPEERQGLSDKVKGKMKDSLVSLATSSYDARADDLEERAVRAMRRAIQEEGERIRELLVANILYLTVWWFVRGDV